MIELVRSNDIVFISWLTATLSAEGIEAVVLDSHASVMDGSIAAIPRRVMVADDDEARARTLMAEAESFSAADTATDEAVSEDALLGGRVRFFQPVTGYRAAIDPILLAAGISARASERVLDVGCGAGAAMLCLAARVPGVQVTGLEIQPALAELAAKNIDANGMDAQLTVLAGDLRTPPASLSADGFDHVMANPPYVPQGRGHAPQNDSRAQAHVEDGATLDDWVRFASAMVRTKGSVTFIQRADRTDALIAAMVGAHLGEVAVYPLWPKAGEDAKRVLVRARKGVKSPARILPGLVLHRTNGGYSPEMDAILEGAAIKIAI